MERELYGRVAWIQLASISSPDQVISEIAAGLGLADVAPEQLPGELAGMLGGAPALLVLDDSGSMDDSDDRRLVVMAALAFAGALEDGDQIMIAGLNELASTNTGPRFVSPRDLLPGRDGAEGTRPIASELLGRLGRHEGQTPCGPALERARSILNTMASSGAPQTVSPSD